MTDIKQAIAFAKQNPNSPFASELRRRIESGELSQELSKAGITNVPSKKGFIEEAKDDIIETAKGVKDAVVKGKKNIEGSLDATIENPDGNLGTDVKALAQSFGQGAGALSEAGGEILKGAVKVVTPFQGVEDAVADTVEEVVTPVVQSEPIQELIKRYEGLDEDTKRSVDSALGVGSLILDFTGAGVGAKGAKASAKVAKEGVEETIRLAKAGKDATIDSVKTAGESIFGRPVKNVDDVIRQADEAITPAEKLKAVEDGTSKTSLVEKWAGISPDIKNRIAGKHEKLKEYFDVAHARNNLDTMPTPLEYGAKKVEDTVGKMEQILTDTGSKIGKFRTKISSYKAGIDDVAKVEKSFENELSKLNLELKKGVIRKKPGTITKVNSATEINALNELYNDIQTIKQAPNLERLIDLRNLFDNKINFAKQTRDVSSSLDPLSRNIRKNIAQVAEKIVGNSEASNLKKYSEFMDGYNELRSFTDRKAGAEFLLKQTLSERGRVPREVLDSIKEFTGVDLMDDAVMSSIATDLIGNSRQKGLFRQELTKAGLDAEQIMSGGLKGGAINLMFELAKRFAVNEEKQFLKAAGKGKKAVK